MSGHATLHAIKDISSKIIVRVCLSVFLIAFPLVTAQAVVTINPGTESVAVAPEVLYFEDQTSSQSFFQAQSQFKRFEQQAAPHDSTLMHLNRQGSVYWLKVTINNATTLQNWVLHFVPTRDFSSKPVWLDEMVVYPNNSAGQPIYTTKNNYIPLSLVPQRQSDYLIMIKTIKGLETSFKPMLETEQRFADYQHSEARHITMSWIIVSIFVTSALIFFILSRLNSFLIFGLYSVIFVQGSMLITDSTKKLYGLLENIVSPVQILPLVATLISLSAVLLISFTIKDKALPKLLKVLLVSLVLIIAGIFFGQTILIYGPLSIVTFSKLVLLASGLVLAIVALTQSFQDTRNIWLMPAWLIFALHSFVTVGSPLVLPFIHLLVLGTGLIVQVYMIWQEQEKVRHDQQQKLQAEMNSLRQSHEKENFMWERKLESERGLLNNAKQRESLRSAQLAEAKGQAEAANKAKSDFLAMITHEIRTPMTGIMGMIHLTAQTQLDEKQHEYIDTIQNAGETLLTLLNDVLDYSKLEKGAISLESIPFNLRMVVQSVMTLMSGRANEKSLRLITHIADDVPSDLEGDPNRIRQVLINLLSNAIKFTETGSITVDISREKTVPNQYSNNHVALKIKVIDTGIGISKEAQEKLFGAYNQADASIARRFGGTGLGLNICRMLVQAMGGDIFVQSGLGKGSTFWFTLVMEKATAQSTSVMAQHDPDLIDIPPLYVLVVDDNPVNLKVIAGLLELDHHRVKTVENGADALRMVENENFDLIFMDIQMPGFDGLTITRAIRKMNDAAKADVPIYALTGMGREEDEQACQAAGMNGILMKPIRVPAFKRVLVTVSHAKYGSHAAASSKEDPMKFKDVVQKTKEVVADVKKTYDDVKEQVRLGLASDRVPPTESGVTQDDPDMIAAMSDPSALLNIQGLEDLRLSLPPESFQDILVDLDSNAEELVEGIITGWKARDTDDIAEKAHNLRGMAGNFGMSLLSSVAERIERAVKIGQDEIVSTEVNRLRTVLTRTQQAMNDWKNGQSV